MESYLTTWKKAFKFQGRSTRKDYWFFLLINFFIYIFILLGNLIQSLIFQFSISNDNDFLGILSKIITFVLVIPVIILLGTVWVALPLTVRRIRDVGMKWQWIFFVSIPYIGFFFVLIFLTRTSVEEINGKKYFPKYWFNRG